MLHDNEIVLRIEKTSDPLLGPLFSVYENDFRHEHPLVEGVSIGTALKVIEETLQDMPGTDSCGV